MEKLKSCSNKDCSQVNPQAINNFAKAAPSIRSKDKLEYRCKECIRKKGREYSKKNREKMKENNKKWLKENPGKASEYTVRYYKKNPDMARGLRLTKYWPGLSWKEVLIKYEELFNKQNGKCAICLSSDDPLNRQLAVDHNHKTNEVRGLLCSHCNTAIGLLKEDEQILLSSIEYLKRKV